MNLNVRFRKYKNMRFVKKIAVRTNWDSEHVYLPVEATHLFHMLSNWHCRTDLSGPSEFYNFFFLTIPSFGFSITNDPLFFCSPNQVIPQNPPIPIPIIR